MKIYIVTRYVDLGYSIEYVTLSKSVAESKCKKYNDKWNKDFPNQFNKEPNKILSYVVLGKPDQD